MTTGTATKKKLGTFRRFWRRGPIKLYLLCLLWAALVAVAQDYCYGPLVRWELATVDYRFLRRGASPLAPEIVILAIDERSFVADTFRGEAEILGRSPELKLLDKFPFKRRAYAAAIKRVCDAGAKVVALDLLFLQPTADEDDQALRSAIADNRDRVVIGRNFSEDGTRVADPTVIVPSNVPFDNVVGYVNYWPDTDRTVRHARFATYESAAAGVDRFPDEQPVLSMDALAVKKFNSQFRLPDAGEDVSINFPGPPGTFPSYAFYNLFYEQAWHQNLKDGAVFRDKIVLIGPGGNFQHDGQPTPFSSQEKEMPGVEIHAAAIATLLHGTALHESLRWVGLLTIFGFGLVTAWLLHIATHPLLKLILLAGVAAAYLAIACGFFTQQGLILLVAAPLAVVAGGGLGGIMVQFVAEQWERRQVRQTLEKYVSKPVADEILRNSQVYENSLGGERREVTTLFADIRDFTTLSENIDPAEMVDQLNEYFTAMTGIIMENEGTVSKFDGDRIMAIYGAPLSAGPAADAARAVRSAYQMRLRLAGLQKSWAEQKRPPLRIGIGLNHGLVLVGNIGSAQRMEYTVMGDAVNVAARIEGLNKELGTDILLSEAVYVLVKNQVEVRPMGAASVKGRSKELQIYALKSIQPDTKD